MSDFEGGYQGAAYYAFMKEVAINDPCRWIDESRFLRVQSRDYRNVRSSSANSKLLTHLQYALRCERSTRTSTHSISTSLLIRNRTTRILNSRFALKHRYARSLASDSVVPGMEDTFVDQTETGMIQQATEGMILGTEASIPDTATMNATLISQGTNLNDCPQYSACYNETLRNVGLAGSGYNTSSSTAIEDALIDLALQQLGTSMSTLGGRDSDDYDDYIIDIALATVSNGALSGAGVEDARRIT